MTDFDLPQLFDYLKWAEGKRYDETARLIRAEIGARLYQRLDTKHGERSDRFKISKLRQCEEAGINPRSFYRKRRQSSTS